MLDLSTLSTIITLGCLFLSSVIFFGSLKIKQLQTQLKQQQASSKLWMSKYQLLKAAVDTTSTSI